MEPFTLVPLTLLHYGLHALRLRFQLLQHRIHKCLLLVYLRLHACLLLVYLRYQASIVAQLLLL